MTRDIIEDRGRGPEIVGTRITVYNLIPYFLDAEVSEAEIAASHGLKITEVAAARAYVLSNAATVLSRHLEIEDRAAQGNSPALDEKLRGSHRKLIRFKEWLAQRDACKAETVARNARFPTFDEWQSLNDSQSAGGA